MSEELVGALMDEGYSPQEVREMMGPMLAERDDANVLSNKIHDPSGREQVLHDILTQARDNRQPPGPTVVVPSGVIHSLPKSRHAKAVRVDTEDSYREFRRRAASDLPEDNIEALSTAVQDELMGADATEVVGNIMDMVPASQQFRQGLSANQTCIVCGADGDVVCPHCQQRLPALIGAFDPERGYASQLIGDVAEDQAAADAAAALAAAMQQAALQAAQAGAAGKAVKLSPGEAAIMNELRKIERALHIEGATTQVKSRIRRVQGILGFDPDRGYASQNIVSLGFGERGSAASLYDDNPSATIDGDDGDGFYRREAELSTVLGREDAEEFYRLERGEGYSQGHSAMVGMDDGFYRLPRMSVEAGGLSALIGDVMALSVPSSVYDEETPLTFHDPEIHKHATTWKQGDSIYSSIRVTGWDGQPRVLTTVTPYAKEVGIVVGYCESVNIPPSHALALLDPLARKFGGSKLFPRLAAAAPSVLRVAHGKSAPIVMTVMPEGDNILGWE